MILLILLLMCISHTRVANYGIFYEVYTPKVVAYFTMGYIVFWASLRIQFVDTAAYIKSFNEANTGLDVAIQVLFQEGKQKGFDFLQILFKTFLVVGFDCYCFRIANYDDTSQVFGQLPLQYVSVCNIYDCGLDV